MDPQAFYQSLSMLEKQYWDAFLALFEQVQPQKPEKGIQALLLRARLLAQTENIPPEIALERTFQEAVERTERRVQLLSQCALKATNSPQKPEQHQ